MTLRRFARLTLSGRIMDLAGDIFDPLSTFVVIQSFGTHLWWSDSRRIMNSLALAQTAGVRLCPDTAEVWDCQVVWLPEGIPPSSRTHTGAVGLYDGEPWSI